MRFSKKGLHWACSTISVFAAINAFALPKLELAPSGVCGDIAQLVKRVKLCESNALLSELAIRCLVTFDQAAEKAGLDLQALLVAQESQQKKSLLENKQNLETTIRQLREMRGKAEVAYHDMNYFLLNTVQPADLDEISQDVGKQKAYAEEQPCFGPERNKIRAARSLFKQRHAALSQALQVAESLSGSSAAIATDFGGVGGKDNSPMLKPSHKAQPGAKGLDVKDSTITERSDEYKKPSR